MKGFSKLEDQPDRIFAIGDIHGCAEELHTLLIHLEESERIGEGDHIVFIGDYIDRGPDSKGVIELLLNFRAKHGGYTTFLKGNHEDMLLDFLGLGGNHGLAYLGNGGREFFDDYGISPELPREDIVEVFPESHLDFFKGLEGILESDKHIFVHAGINPNIELEEQVDNCIYWVRNEFIDISHNFDKTVIFGHTPYDDLFFDLPFKIGIDTGLVYGNALSCIEVIQRMTYQVGFADDRVVVSSFDEKGAASNSRDSKQISTTL